jgi:hypothetical protein
MTEKKVPDAAAIDVLGSWGEVELRGLFQMPVIQ